MTTSKYKSVAYASQGARWSIDSTKQLAAQIDNVTGIMPCHVHLMLMSWLIQVFTDQ